MEITNGLLYSYYIYINNSNRDLIDDVVYNNDSELTDITDDKLDLFSNFAKDLITKIDVTYLGDEVMEGQDEYLPHYKWCLDSLIKDYDKKGVVFDLDPLLNNYIYLIICENYYYLPRKKPEIVEKLYTFFKNVLNYKKSNIDSRLSLMLWILFNKSLK